MRSGDVWREGGWPEPRPMRSDAAGAPTPPGPQRNRRAGRGAAVAEGPLWRRSRVPPEAPGPGRRREGGAGPVGRERGMEKLRRLWRGRTMTFGVPLLVSGAAGAAQRGQAAGGAGPRRAELRAQLSRGWALCRPLLGSGCAGRRGAAGAQGHGYKTHS